MHGNAGTKTSAKQPPAHVNPTVMDPGQQHTISSDAPTPIPPHAMAGLPPSRPSSIIVHARATAQRALLSGGRARAIPRSR
mmetsp:Transcript_28548/g.71281  ORF Transcript_28548/g.71281 Transcript_28548/m.71281 type:complete len:81 (-) Transcript_28548:183-425(-)